MIQLEGPQGDREYLLSTGAIREKAQKVYEIALAGGTQFEIKREKIPELAKFVAQVTRENYPRLNIPYHSRWKHFNAGGVDRLRSFYAAIEKENPEERLRIKTDLVIVSVLLDAGAGMAWTYLDAGKKEGIGKSEGLAVASFRAFQSGSFSSTPKSPFRVDAIGVQSLGWDSFRQHFQIAYNNPLEGDKGRYDLLKTMGRMLQKKPEFFGTQTRLGNIANHWIGKKSIPATAVLRTIQDGLGSIWPGRVQLNEYNLGDVWPCPCLGEGIAGLMPFHKLSQWLTYSLLDPIAEAGIEVTDINELTGLAEYRNGGLFIDGEVLVPRGENALARTYEASDPFVVEWRALTLALLNEIAPLVRRELNLTEDKLPLGKVLEGGTWWAGRKIAAQKRGDGGPPVRIKSDGTVF
jgi:hypothetical protein